MEYSAIKEVILPPQFVHDEDMEWELVAEKMTETYTKIMIPLALILLVAFIF